MFRILSLLLLVPICLAALPTCPSGVSKSPAGIWTEWAISGSPNCSTPCGSCSKLFHTRRCLTSTIGQTCIGDSTRFYPCNTQTCIYPAQRTCCNPSVPMLINGIMQCGPLSKDPAASLPVSSKPCCPAGGGSWTEWTKFARDKEASEWIRTRECPSLEAGCPCKGEEKETSNTCPCKKPVRATSCPVTGTTNPSYFRELVVNDKECTGTLELQASNDGLRYCHNDKDIKYAPVIRFLFADGENKNACDPDRPFNCEERKKEEPYAKMPVSFSCDLETLFWRYDAKGWLITAYVQSDFINVG